MDRLSKAIAGIDAANGRDPNRVPLDGAEVPAELVYGQRMSAMLARVYPNASEALQLAVRAQHIRRWEVPRSTYPMDRPGYLRWRKELGRKHAEWAGEILAASGYSAEEIARVGSLLRKENLRRDAETQALEDVAALVFLAHYAEDFAAKHPPEKVVNILAKTLGKMSEHGKEAACALDLLPAVRHALELAIAEATDP
ncbi:DUF4202 domain-containing protein [Hyphomicrobium sp.]|uniref:DUF4202 domain-containing protein n=1 Tax=Hyphomicrobium sp. TaxID=82 RepID=UPI0025C082E8|nr:DUF4202 domain-containing protein [Hyphomicrobium sp.]MCC7252260.1 DUF4202 domain-containing protein [Hyphomicrobium sp.]